MVTVASTDVFVHCLMMSYTALDFLEGIPLPTTLQEHDLQLTIVDLEDVGLVNLPIPCSTDPAEPDASAQERSQLGLPLDFSASKHSSRSKRKSEDITERPNKKQRGDIPARLRKQLGRNLFKYLKQRYSLFSKFDSGIQLDAEGWYSTTPECIAKHHSQKAANEKPRLVMDAFCGVGGNAIQFAMGGHIVIASETDKERLEMAQHNAGVYGVSHRVEFILGDAFEVMKRLKPDVVFLSPPWGGPHYSYSDTMILGKDEGLGYYLWNAIGRLREMKMDIMTMMYLPRNVDLCSLIELVGWMNEVEIIRVNGCVKALTAYLTLS